MPSVSVVPHGKGFRVVYREGGRGSKRHWSETRTKKREAVADAEVIRARLLAAQPLKAGRVRLTWLEVCTRWHEGRDPGRYRDEGLKVLQALGWKTTEDATPDVVAKLKLGTRRLVNSCLRFARRQLKQPVDMDALDIPLPKSNPKPERDLLPAEETDALVQEAFKWSPGNGTIAHICATYGHRAASLVGLTGEAVDFTRSRILMPIKRHGPKWVKMRQETMELLRKLKPKKGKPLFVNHLGVPWATGKAFSNWYYHRLGKKALASSNGNFDGRKVGYYQTKSAAITTMLAACGNDAKSVAAITLHKRPSLLLDVYARTNEELQDRVLAGARPAG